MALPNESGRPGWHFRYPRIELSEFANWNAVRDWALPMYRVQSPDDPALVAKIAELKREPDAAKRIVAALRFVQDDIRYTGLEIGAGAWRPTQPNVVLARRYGDCKDKVLLFVTLLRGLGIEAVPALVNSTSGRGIEARLQSPGVFDHVVAKMRWQGRDYWLDATASGQGGQLDTLVQADFGRALVLGPGKGDLEPIPARDAEAPTNYVVETYDFRNGSSKTALLTVRTVLRADEADAMRVKMRSNTAKSLGKDYLDYYRKSYQRIRAGQPLKWSDDRTKNEVTIVESYAIDTPFETDSKGKRTFDLEAYLITEQTRPPDQPVRTSPLARHFPLHVRQEIVAYLSGEWNFNDETVEIADPAFAYRSIAKYRQHKLELSYDLRNKRDYVPISELSTFLTKLGQVHDDSYYTLRDNEAEAQPAAPVALPRKGPSFELIATLFLGLGLGVWASKLLAQLRWKLPEAQPGTDAGLGGWMILPVIGVVCSPFVQTFGIYKFFRDIGSAEQFQNVDGVIQCLLLLEFLLLCSLLVIAAFGAWIMFMRYRTFPYAFVVMETLGCLVLLVDNVALAIIGAAGTTKDGPEFGHVVIQMVMAALWSAYILTSQRVRATFVNPWGGVEAPGTKTVPSA